MNNEDALHTPSLARQLMYDPMTFVLVPEGEKNRLPWPGTGVSIPAFPREIHPSIQK